MLVEMILQEKGTEIITVRSDANVGDLVALLAQKNVGAVLALDEYDHLVGIVSERDIVRQLAREPEGLLSRPVADIMTRKLVTCEPGDTLDEVMSRMTRGRFRHIPVLSEGRLAGVISIGDVVKRKIELVEQEAGALREYIAS